MMNTKVEAQIRQILGDRYGVDMVDTLLNDWQRYFASVGLDDSQQGEEFEAVMRARVRSGSISLVAPAAVDRSPTTTVRRITEKL
jgi:hypothetical protein